MEKNLYYYRKLVIVSIFVPENIRAFYKIQENVLKEKNFNQEKKIQPLITNSSRESREVSIQWLEAQG